MAYANSEDQREYARNWYMENRERQQAYRRARWIRDKQADPERVLLRAAQQRASRVGRECTITREDIIIPDVCPVLGIPITVGSGRAVDGSASLDRIDSTKGYTPGNIAVISWRANRIKTDATASDLRLIADWMDSHG